MKCPICGTIFRSTRRHLQKYHRIKFSSEREARLYLRLYSIFKKRHLDLPLKHPEKMDYEEILAVMDNMSKIFRRPAIATNLFTPYAKALAKTHPELVLDNFPSIAKTSNKIRRILSIFTISLVNSSKIVPILIDLCDRKTLVLLNYVANAFRKYYDALENEIKKVITSNKPLRSPYFFFHALLLSRPDKLGDLLITYIQGIGEQKFKEQITEFYDLFNSFIELPKKYFQTEKNRQSLRLLANILFFSSRKISIPHELLDDMISVYVVLADLDYYWARIYYGCQRRIKPKTPTSLNSIGDKKPILSDLIKNITHIIGKYPFGVEKLRKINISAYHNALEEIPGGFTKCYFLYIMADINFRHGLIDTANILLKELDKHRTSNYVFMPHVYLLKANIEEIVGNIDKSLEHYEYLAEKDISWQKFLFDYARALILKNNYEKALNILKEAPNTPYKIILLAYIHSILDNDQSSEIKLKEITYCGNPRKAFYVILSMERICNCMYDEAWSIAAKNNIQITLLDTIMVSCERHYQNFLRYLKRTTINENIGFYLGLLELEEERYNNALEYFKSSLPNPLIDKKVLYVNMLLAAMMINDAEAVDNAVKFLKSHIDDPPAIGIAIIHYYLWKKKYSDAYSLLTKLRDDIDFDAYAHLKKLITKKKFDTTYYTYFYTSKIRPLIICPLLAVEVP